VLTLFTVPKPFDEEIGIIQRNAIQSWLRLHADCQIILCGDEKGTREACLEFKIEQIPSVARNEYGTPLLNSVFKEVERNAHKRLLCYVNADIILMADFLSAVRSIPLQRFLMVGQRWDTCITKLLDFGGPDWEDRVKKKFLAAASLHPPTGSDYFVFPRGLIGQLPPFAVGRPSWDNWLLYQGLSLRIPVIDATQVTTVIHQNHDYRHVKSSMDGTTEGPEAETNRELAGAWTQTFSIRDATHLLRWAGPDNLAPRAVEVCRKKRMFLFPLLQARKKLGYLGGAGVRALKRHFFSH
jgi:hypothetical protein